MTLYELKDTLNLLDRFIGHYPIYMYLTDIDHTVAWFNRYMSRMLPNIVLGQHLACENVLNPCQDICDGCLDTASTNDGEFSRKLYRSPESEDKAERCLEFFSFPIFDASCETVGKLRIGIDVTQSEQQRETLRAQEKRYKSIIETSADGIIFLDREGLIRSWNKGATDILGYEEAEVLGQSIEMIMPDELIEMDERKHLQKEMLAKGHITKYETQRRHRDGHQIHVDISCSDVIDEGGTSIGVSEIIKDIQARKELEFDLLRTILELSKLNELNEILYQTHDEKDILRITLIAITAGQGLRFNRAFILLGDPETNQLRGHLAIGPSDEQEASRIWSELNKEYNYLRDIVQIYKIDLDGADRKVNELVGQITVGLDEDQHILIESLKKRKVLRVENRQCLSDPNTFTLDSNGTNIADLLRSDTFVVAPVFSKSEHMGVIIADNCINNREISGEDVEGLRLLASMAGAALENARLYQKLQVRVLEVQDAYHQLEEQQAQLLRAERLVAIGEMSAKVAHEIRNPLVSIGGFARMIERKIKEDDKLKEYAGIIREQVDNLEDILNNLLDTANPKEPNKQVIDIKEVLQQVAQIMANTMIQNKITMNLEWPPDEDHCIMGDPRMLYQAFLNIVKNALEALESCDTGVVVMKSAIQSEKILVTISDSGPGISEDKLKRIFEKFYTTKSRGTGLGLSVVREIIASHQGDIVVHSTPDAGTVFQLSFPLANKT